METEKEMLDCMQPMRRYILKTKQSAWAKSSRRIVVLSPQVTLPSSKQASLIPAMRHYPKQNHQDVRLLSTNDIERDSCTVYRRERVETGTKWKNAHGVAIVDSVPGHKFTYKRGDKFWLYIKQHQKPEDIGIVSVPVINLKNYETGTIFTQHVCWFPVARGPAGELWTFGGLEKTVCGANKKLQWIWAVAQADDGKTTVCDMVQVTENCEIKFAARSALFKARMELMESRLKEATNRGKKMLVHSYLEMLKDSRKKKQYSPINAIRRIMADLILSNAAEVKSPPDPSSSRASSTSATRQSGHDSPSPGNRSQLSPRVSAAQADSPPTKRRRLSVPASAAQDDQPPAKHRRLDPPVSRAQDSDLRSGEHLSSPSQPDRRQEGNYVKNPSDEVDGVLWSLYTHKPLNKPFIAVDEIAHNPTLISAAYDRWRKHVCITGRGGCAAKYCPKVFENGEDLAKAKAKLATYCSNKDPDCPYTELLPPHSRRPHIHFPASKCVFQRLNPGGPHIHCVTDRDVPWKMGACLFRRRYLKVPEQMLIQGQCDRVPGVIPEGKEHLCCCKWSDDDIAKSDFDERQAELRAHVHPYLRPIRTHPSVKECGQDGKEIPVMPTILKPIEPFQRFPPTEEEIAGVIKYSNLIMADEAEAQLLLNIGKEVRHQPESQVIDRNLPMDPPIENKEHDLENAMENERLPRETETWQHFPAATRSSEHYLGQQMMSNEMMPPSSSLVEGSNSGLFGQQIMPNEMIPNELRASHGSKNTWVELPQGFHYTPSYDTSWTGHLNSNSNFTGAVVQDSGSAWLMSNSTEPPLGNEQAGMPLMYMFGTGSNAISISGQTGFSNMRSGFPQNPSITAGQNPYNDFQATWQPISQQPTNYNYQVQNPHISVPPVLNWYTNNDGP